MPIDLICMAALPLTQKGVAVSISNATTEEEKRSLFSPRRPPH